MIYFDIMINWTTIDTIAVQRIEGKPGEMCEYQIRYPKGFESIKIYHHYDKGYFPLMCATIEALREGGYNPQKGELHATDETKMRRAKWGVESETTD